MIEARPLTPEAFAPFGSVARNRLGEVKPIRDGGVVLTKTATRCAHDESARDFAIDFYDVSPESGLLHMTQAEQHPHSAQFFMAFSANRYLVVVWPGDPALDVRPQAFVAGGQDIVIYDPGVWHHGIVALQQRTLFASAMWKAGEGGTDTVFRKLETGIDVAWMDAAA